MNFLISFIAILSQVLSFAVLAHVILSYFLDPYHPIRQAIDRVVSPMLNPLRRIIPNVGMFDFSPMVLLLIIQFGSEFIISILR
jgi:YggT family protein